MLHAVIGIGSNSTRMLIGEVADRQVTPQARYREGTRLFAGLKEGNLSGESMMRTADVVARFAREAFEKGVANDCLHIIATSAARDAGNGAEFRTLIEDMCGVPMELITGEEEAQLSFLGGAGQGYSGLVDIGGGSTEVAVGGGARPVQAASAQLGAVRLLGEVPLLVGDGLEKAYQIARERITGVWDDMKVNHPPHAWFAVGGTATCIASLEMKLPVYDREQVDGHVLGRAAVENWARRLAKMNQGEREKLPGMIPARADIIAHGTIILWAVMEGLGIERIVVSNRSNLDGYLYQIAGGTACDSVETVKAFYNASVESEWNRLEARPFEFEINRHFIDRYVKPGDRVLDAGGGPGRYSLYLAERGADVTLLDLSQGNVEFAQQKAKELGLSIQAQCADACTLDTAVEGQFDAVLLMGPLYHLLEEADRKQAVEACLRVLRPGGVLCIAFISLVGGMVYAAREAPESILWEREEVFYRKVVDKEDFAGEAFTQAFFIQPEHILPWMEKFPLETLHLLGSEGVTAPFHAQMKAAEPEVRSRWVDLSIKLCERPDFFNYSEHMLYIGRKEA